VREDEGLEGLREGQSEKGPSQQRPDELTNEKYYREPLKSIIKHLQQSVTKGRGTKEREEEEIERS